LWNGLWLTLSLDFPRETIDDFLQLELVRKILSYFVSPKEIWLLFSVLYVVAFVFKIIITGYLGFLKLSFLIFGPFNLSRRLVLLGVAAAPTSRGFKP
jgi:hypothetical protein